MILNILLWSLEREILNYHVRRQNVYVLINCTGNIMENVAIIIFNDVNRYIHPSIFFNQLRVVLHIVELYGSRGKINKLV